MERIAKATQRSSLVVSIEVTMATCGQGIRTIKADHDIDTKLNKAECTETKIIAYKKLTRPTTAEPMNESQSIGVKPGFFFSGCKGKRFGSSNVHACFTRKLYKFQQRIGDSQELSPNQPLGYF